MTMRVLIVGLALLVAGCSGSPEPEPREPSDPTGASSPSAQEIVDDPDARLYAVDVSRSGGSIEVTSMWVLERRPGRLYAVVESEDGFHTGRYVAGGERQLQRALQQSRPEGAGRDEGCSQVAGGVDLCFDYTEVRARWTGNGGDTWSSAHVDLDRLITWPVTSLAVDVLAVAGGGDGATLFPFERVVASVNGGSSWKRFDVPRLGGEMAYTSGLVVTREGNLLALLDHFSGDRPNRPSDPHHGLWASAGSDWSTYHPVLSRMTPRPTPAPDAGSGIVSLGASADPDPLIWFTTWDHRLYVSTDDAATFREIPAR